MTKLIWTSNKPTVDGWYWYRDYRSDKPKIIWGMIIQEVMWFDCFIETTGQFAGPIPEPEEG